MCFILVLQLFMRIVVVNPPHTNHGAPVFVSPKRFWVLFHRGVLEQQRVTSLCSPTAKLAMGSLAQNSFGAIWCSCNPRFRRRFRRVPVQRADEVPEGSGAES